MSHTWSQSCNILLYLTSSWSDICTGFLPPWRLASTNVLIVCTQLSKLWGVTCAASLTRNANVSQVFISALVSWCFNSPSSVILYWFTFLFSTSSLLTCKIYDLSIHVSVKPNKVIGYMTLIRDLIVLADNDHTHKKPAACAGYSFNVHIIWSFETGSWGRLVQFPVGCISFVWNRVWRGSMNTVHFTVTLCSFKENDNAYLGFYSFS